MSRFVGWYDSLTVNPFKKSLFFGALFLIFTFLIVVFKFLAFVDSFLALPDRPYYTTLNYFTVMIPDNYGLRAVSIIPLIVICLLIYRKNKAKAVIFFPFIALLVDNLAVAFFKYSLNRSKPSSLTSIFFSQSHSYPSGHIVNIILMYNLSLLLIIKYQLVSITRLKPYLYINLSLTIIFTLTSLIRNTHWFTDLVGGSLLAFSLLYLSIAIGNKLKIFTS